MVQVVDCFGLKNDILLKGLAGALPLTYPICYPCNQMLIFFFQLVVHMLISDYLDYLGCFRIKGVEISLAHFY